jgi:hypothetical protein
MERMARNTSFQPAAQGMCVLSRSPISKAYAAATTLSAKRTASEQDLLSKSDLAAACKSNFSAC